jgi:two-component system, LuxR family, sensor kinase FixL
MFVLASIVDISARKQAESEVQRLRRDLAHVGRVATMGELTASLAHELNQPLTAILTNAQAAQMLLSSGRATAQELAEILADIASDDKRAGEVIHRLRTLLTKGESERTPLDLSEVTREVMRLVRTDALIRNVSLEMDLADGLPLVAGDRVQLQQVILNLIFNGLEAMRDSTVGDRHLLVTTRRTEVGVRVSIHDRGPGIQEADLSRVFEPFYTTKATGMGIGLSIARSIVEAHGGSLWAENHAAGGAAFSFAIPVDVSPPG